MDAEARTDHPISSAHESTYRLPSIADRPAHSGPFHRFVRQPLGLVGLTLLMCVVLFAFVLPVFWPHSYDIYTDDLSASPSWDHPFGTDQVGFDTLSQVARGSQRSLEIAFLVGVTATLFGAIVGAASGFIGGKVDLFMMRLADLVLVFPGLAVAAFLSRQAQGSGGSWLAVAIVLAALGWPVVARLVRAEVLAARSQNYVLAARGAGASSTSILFRHMLPNALGTVLVAGSILTVLAILAESALSFLGFGVQEPDTSLGLLVNQGQTAIGVRPWLFYFPGLFIVLIAISISLIGDAIRFAFDPRQSSSGRS
jgi:peptide/nickel transport system permease protein